jgi:hypothetical protein
MSDPSVALAREALGVALKNRVTDATAVRVKIQREMEYPNRPAPGWDSKAQLMRMADMKPTGKNAKFKDTIAEAKQVLADHAQRRTATNAVAGRHDKESPAWQNQRRPPP